MPGQIVHTDGKISQMPRFKCHKHVWALKIKSIKAEKDGGAILTPERSDFALFSVDKGYCDKHKPQAGGYFVAYEDNYASWSPAHAFENGYEEAP